MSRCSARDQRAHLRLGIDARADLHLGQPLLDRRHERIGRVADRDHRGHGHAALAGRAVARADGGVGRHLDVRVWQHDHVVLRPAERLDALSVRGAGLVDVARDRSRADEADRGDVAVLEDRVDRDLVPVHDVEDAVGQAGLLQQFGDVRRRGRVLLGRLEHERVPARDRRRPHPHRDHGREVERRDPRDDSERLTDRVDVDSGRGLLREVAAEQRRDPARVLDHLEPALHLALRVGQHLAVLVREDGRDVAEPVVDELADPEHQLRSARERDLAPGRERLLRGRDRLANLLDGGEIDLARLDSERRVVDGAAAAGRAQSRLAADPVADPAHFRPLGDVRHASSVPPRR